MAKYWIGDSGDWADITHWSLSSGGTGGEPEPDETDNVFFDGNSFSLAGQTVTISMGSACRDIDTTAATNDPVLQFGSFSMNSASLNINGNAIFSPAMGITSSDLTDPGLLVFNATGTLTTNGLVIGVDINSQSGVVTQLLDDLTMEDGMIADFVIQSGAIDFNGKIFNLTQTTDRGYLALDSNSLFSSATINLTVLGTMGAFRCEDLALDPQNSTIVLSGATDSKALLFNTHHEVNAISRVALNNVTIMGTSGLVAGSAKEDAAIVGGWNIAHLTISPSAKFYLRDQGPSS